MQQQEERCKRSREDILRLQKEMTHAYTREGARNLIELTMWRGAFMQLRNYMRRARNELGNLRDRPVGFDWAVASYSLYRQLQHVTSQCDALRNAEKAIRKRVEELGGSYHLQMQARRNLLVRQHKNTNLVAARVRKRDLKAECKKDRQRARRSEAQIVAGVRVAKQTDPHILRKATDTAALLPLEWAPGEQQ